MITGNHAAKLNYDFRERLEACAGMVKAFELAAEYAEVQKNKRLDFWSMFTQLRHAVDSILEMHSHLEKEVGFHD